MVGAKNVISTMLQSFIAMGLVSVLWVVFGFSLAFGNDIGGVVGEALLEHQAHDGAGLVVAIEGGESVAEFIVCHTYKVINIF